MITAGTHSTTVKKLIAVGFPENQAEVMTDVFDSEITSDIKIDLGVIKQTMTTLATKSELQEVKSGLKAEIEIIKQTMATKIELQEVKSELKAEIQEVKSELKAEIQEVKTELEKRFIGLEKDMRWIMLILTPILGLLIKVAFFG